MNLFCCFSCVIEDVEEAFVKTPDSRPLLLYLRTGDRKGEKEEVSTLSPSTRDLLERVNKADKSAKLKVISNYSYGFKNSVEIPEVSSEDNFFFLKDHKGFKGFSKRSIEFFF